MSFRSLPQKNDENSSGCHSPHWNPHRSPRLGAHTIQDHLGAHLLNPLVWPKNNPRPLRRRDQAPKMNPTTLAPPHGRPACWKPPRLHPMGTHLAEYHLGTTPVAPSQLCACVCPPQLNIYSFNPNSKRDQVPKANPIHLGGTLWAPTLSGTTYAPPCGRPDCANHVGSTPRAPILFQTLIRPKTT